MLLLEDWSPHTMTDYLFIYRDDGLLIQPNQKQFTLPKASIIESIGPENFLSKFRFASDTEAHYYIVEMASSTTAPEGYDFISLREARDYYGQALYAMALQSFQLLNWQRNHRFCGVCGHPFDPMKEDRSLSCPKCHHLLFPHTSTAVIVAIIKDDKILLAHNAKFPQGLYSLVAGFVEMGESFEAAAHREIYEEVGLKVKNLRYFDNQPWPFPNSTMIGYFADYDSGEIQVDGTEILDAHWYTPETFPLLPSGYSIARRIIEAYRAEYNNE